MWPDEARTVYSIRKVNNGFILAWYDNNTNINNEYIYFNFDDLIEGLHRLFPNEGENGA